MALARRKKMVGEMMEGDPLERIRDAGESSPEIDAAAQDALDRMRLDQMLPVDVSTVMKPMNWRLLVVPKKPPATLGSIIEVTDSEKEREEYLTHLGRIVAMGPLAFTARTQGGVDMGADPHKPKIGDWVLFPHNGGIRFRLKDKQAVVLLSDVEVLAVTEHPDDFMFYL